MNDHIQGQFEKLSDSELLATISFFQNEYTSQTLALLKEVASKRGVTDATIRRHREDCCTTFGLEFKCDSCGCELRLTATEFVDGAYECPDCKGINPVNYMNLGLPKEIGEFLSEVAVVAAGSVAGGIFLALRENRKYTERRERILDGTYWKALQVLAQTDKSKK